MMSVSHQHTNIQIIFDIKVVDCARNSMKDPKTVPNFYIMALLARYNLLPVIAELTQIGGFLYQKTNEFYISGDIFL